MSEKIVFCKTKEIELFRYNDRFYVVSDKVINEFKTRLILPYEAKFIGYSNTDVIKIVYALYDNNTKITIKELNRSSLHYIAYFSKVKEKEI